MASRRRSTALATAGRRARSPRSRQWVLVLLATLLAGCLVAPTPAPAIEALVVPIGPLGASGQASLSDIGSGMLNVHVAVEASRKPVAAADLRRGDCESTDIIGKLDPYDPASPTEFDGSIAGSLTSTPPVVVLVLDADGQPIGCALFP